MKLHLVKTLNFECILFRHTFYCEHWTIVVYVCVCAIFDGRFCPKWIFELKRKGNATHFTWDALHFLFSYEIYRAADVISKFHSTIQLNFIANHFHSKLYTNLLKRKCFRHERTNTHTLNATLIGTTTWPFSDII